MIAKALIKILAVLFWQPAMGGLCSRQDLTQYKGVDIVTDVAGHCEAEYRKAEKTEETLLDKLKIKCDQAKQELEAIDKRIERIEKDYKGLDALKKQREAIRDKYESLRQNAEEE